MSISSRLMIKSRTIFRETAWFLATACVYYFPLLLDASALQIKDARVARLASAAFDVPAVQLDVARNLIGHLAPLLALHATCALLASRLHRRTGIAPGLSRALYLLSVWLLLNVANSYCFPLSDYAQVYSALRGTNWIWFSLALGTTLLLLSFFSMEKKEILGIALLATTVTTYIAISPHGSQPPRTASDGRHIIIIGVDSLSAMTLEDNLPELPNIRQLIESGRVYEHAYTPIGRTCPAWMSILTGKQPAEHGAIFNLRNPTHVTRDGLLTTSLRKLGYRTIFAIDERRFCHIDETYGFDQIVGPKAGALDFLVQPFNDTPITNFLLQTGWGEWFLPFSRLNVASFANYDYTGFVQQTLHATQGADRLFLAAHFESAHFPFKSRASVRRKDLEAHSSGSFEKRQLYALTTVDEQIGLLLAGLRQRGYLDNALVILLSDHGESLGMTEATITESGTPVEIRTYGHGTSALSEFQNRVVLAQIPFIDGIPAPPSARESAFSSLLSVKHFAEHYAETGNITQEESENCIFVETDIRFQSAENYQTLSLEALAAEGAALYEIDSNGKMLLRESAMHGLISAKDFGYRCINRLTYRSSISEKYFSYFISPDGHQFNEIEPLIEDIQRIEAYRRKSLELALKP